MSSKLELWNRKVGKSLKIGKNRIKSEKSDLISYPTFWQKCQNAINCHKMPKCLHFRSGSCIRIFFVNDYNSETGTDWNQRSYIVGETHHKISTRARAFYLLKNRIKSENQIMGIRLLLDFLKSDSTTLVWFGRFGLVGLVW